MRCPATASRSRATPELPPLIVIAGATATGKTDLALALAHDIPNAEIVSADSRQVYRGMDIATAKPTAAEQAAAPHHCLDLVDPDQPFSVADYQRAALEALAGIAARSGTALLVGGTGLYLRAIARGLPLDQRDADASVRAELEARFEMTGLQPLVTELRALDPGAAAAIDLHNPRRVIRALERGLVTGSALPPTPRGYPAPRLWLGLSLDPSRHRERIEQRIKEHFAAGLLEEADRLRHTYPERSKAFSAMGYREAFDVLAGRSSTEDAMATDAARTWAYARRQGTWFRAESDIEWLPPGEATGTAARLLVASFIEASAADVYAGQR
jgi:tRNA dimethylallyltransferase